MRTMNTWWTAILVVAVLGWTTPLHAEEPAADSLAAKVATLLRADGSPDAAVTVLEKAIASHGGNQAWFDGLLTALHTLNHAGYASEARDLILSWAGSSRRVLSRTNNARIVSALAWTIVVGETVETPWGLVAGVRPPDYLHVPGAGSRSEKETPLEKKIRAALEPLKQLKALEPKTRPAVIQDVKSSFKGVGPEAYPVLARIARESSPDVAGVAIQLIAGLGGADAIPFLEALIFESDPLTRSTTIRSLSDLVRRGDEERQAKEWAWLITVEDRLDELGRKQLWQDVLRRRMSDDQLSARYRAAEGDIRVASLAAWLDHRLGPGTPQFDALHAELRARTGDDALPYLRLYARGIGRAQTGLANLTIGPKQYIRVVERVELPELRNSGVMSPRAFDVTRELRGLSDDRIQGFREVYYRWLWTLFADPAHLEGLSEDRVERLWKIALLSDVHPTADVVASPVWQRRFLQRLEGLPRDEGTALVVQHPNLIDLVVKKKSGAEASQFLYRGLRALAQEGRAIDWRRYLGSQAHPGVIKAAIVLQASEFLDWAESNVERCDEVVFAGKGGPNTLEHLARWDAPRARALLLSLLETDGREHAPRSLLEPSTFASLPRLTQDALLESVIGRRAGELALADAIQRLDLKRHRELAATLLRESVGAEWAESIWVKPRLVELAMRDRSPAAVTLLLHMYKNGDQMDLVGKALDTIRAHHERLASFESWVDGDGKDATAQLLESLQSEDAATRRAAVLALTAMESKKALPVFVKLSTKDPDERVRAAALHALEKMAGMTK